MAKNKAYYDRLNRSRAKAGLPPTGPPKPGEIRAEVGGAKVTAQTTGAKRDIDDPLARAGRRYQVLEQQGNLTPPPSSVAEKYAGQVRRKMEADRSQILQSMRGASEVEMVGLSRRLRAIENSPDFARARNLSKTFAEHQDVLDNPESGTVQTDQGRMPVDYMIKRHQEDMAAKRATMAKARVTKLRQEINDAKRAGDAGKVKTLTGQLREAEKGQSQFLAGGGQGVIGRNIHAPSKAVVKGKNAYVEGPGKGKQGGLVTRKDSERADDIRKRTSGADKIEDLTKTIREAKEVLAAKDVEDTTRALAEIRLSGAMEELDKARKAEKKDTTQEERDWLRKYDAGEFSVDSMPDEPDTVIPHQFAQEAEEIRGRLEKGEAVSKEEQAFLDSVEGGEFSMRGDTENWEDVEGHEPSMVRTPEFDGEMGPMAPRLEGWEVLDDGVDSGVKMYKTPDGTVYTRDIATGEKNRVMPDGKVEKGWGDVTREQIAELEAGGGPDGGPEKLTTELGGAVKKDLAKALNNIEIDPERATKTADDLAERFGEEAMRGFPAFRKIREQQKAGILPQSPQQIRDDRAAILDDLQVQFDKAVAAGDEDEIMRLVATFNPYWLENTESGRKILDGQLPKIKDVAAKGGVDAAKDMWTSMQEIARRHIDGKETEDETAAREERAARWVKAREEQKKTVGDSIRRRRDAIGRKQKTLEPKMKRLKGFYDSATSGKFSPDGIPMSPPDDEGKNSKPVMTLGEYEWLRKHEAEMADLERQLEEIDAEEEEFAETGEYEPGMGKVILLEKAFLRGETISVRFKMLTDEQQQALADRLR